MIGQEFGHASGILHGTGHAQLQRFEAAHQQPPAWGSAIVPRMVRMPRTGAIAA